MNWFYRATYVGGSFYKKELNLPLFEPIFCKATIFSGYLRIV